jgi:hypothetical protein
MSSYQTRISRTPSFRSKKLEQIAQKFRKSNLCYFTPREPASAPALTGDQAALEQLAKGSSLSE